MLSIEIKPERGWVGRETKKENFFVGNFFCLLTLHAVVVRAKPDRSVRAKAE
jgi:hypothetical protein